MNTNMHPLSTIDVVIPAYNAERFIVLALHSVVAQTVLPQKVIVVNDGSTDTTLDLVTAFAHTSPVPVVIVNKSNAGLSAARNSGIKESTAEYIAFLDADDVWKKSKLEEQLKKYTEGSWSNLGLVYCNYDLIDQYGIPDKKSYKVSLDTHMRGKVFKRLIHANKILSSGSGVLIKKAVFDTVGIFDETLRYGEDWDMWLRIAQSYEVDFTTKVLVHIRRHSMSMTSPKRNVFAGEVAFYKKWIPLLKMKGYTMPLRWRIKLLFRIITQLNNTETITSALPLLLVPFCKSVYKNLDRKL